MSAARAAPGVIPVRSFLARLAGRGHLEPNMPLFDLMECKLLALRVVQGFSGQEEMELKALIIAWDSDVEHMSCQGFAEGIDDIMMNMRKLSRKSLSPQGSS